MNRRHRQAGGWTLIKLLVGFAILGIVASLVVPALLSILNRIAVQRVIADIEAIGFEIREFERFEERLPTTLDELEGGPHVDRWGNPYRYLPSMAEKWSSERRKDRFMVPLNADFDLYSMGPDGDSAPPLTAQASWDDIVWANDGLYLGPANEF